MLKYYAVKADDGHDYFEYAFKIDERRLEEFDTLEQMAKYCYNGFKRRFCILSVTEIDEEYYQCF